MKKAILTGFVIISFVLYSFHQRNDDSTAIIKPTAPSSSSSSGSGNSNSTTVTYKDGQYTGNAADAYYGYIQVLAVISSGRLTDVRFLQYPNDRSNSIEINSQAMPYLKQEAIQAQSANVNIVSGATDTSQAFTQSLSSALNSAKN